MKFFYAFILVCALSITLWLGISKDKNPKLSFTSPLEPQEYMIEAAVWSFTPEGTLKHFLSADYWAYLPNTQSSTLITPHLTVYKPDKSLWKMNAKKAIIQQPTLGSIERVDLSKNVVLQRTATPILSPIKVETEAICYHPKKEYAETDAFITLTKPDLKVTGVGMRAFLNDSAVELLHNVKTSYISNVH